MPLFEPFAHYLGYLSTDQETFRSLAGKYTGIVVPGTIAAWQEQGTGGFVLTLSATDDSPPYVIDPRFPLFQQSLAQAKASHTALAEIFGDRDLVQVGHTPEPGDFDDARLTRLAAEWAEFCSEYDEVPSAKTFEKYARRLEEDISTSAERVKPEAVLPPYFAVEGVDDPWWERSQKLFELTCDAVEGMPVYQVVCVDGIWALADVLRDTDADSPAVVWVSNLNELKATHEELVEYRNTIEEASARGQSTFALYGGFFSVLLRGVGLCGSAHGVGFGEHRDWRELPNSGAPPARFYVRRAHRFFTVDAAQQLFQIDPALTSCECDYCGNAAPGSLEYHDLMKHSVACREEEIRSFKDISLANAAEVLRVDHEAMATQVAQADLLPRIQERLIDGFTHMSRWADAIDPDFELPG